MNILINTPNLKLPGGVANYYAGLRDYWKEEVDYNIVGHRNGIPGPIILIYDYLKFIIICISGKYDVILLNPSLGKTAVRRDALFLNIATLFNVKTVVFFRGWADEMVAKIDNNPESFIKTFNKASKILVLANAFKADLIRWGISQPIHLTSTKVNDGLLDGFDFNDKVDNANILFLTRVEEYKGIFTTLEAYSMIKSIYPNATLTIAGDGSKLAQAKEFVNNKIKDVSFLGNITGEELTRTFSNASIYILPSHSEGMPNSVLEAMAFGLPIISRPIGGLVDFFEEDKMGYLIESLQPEEYAYKIIHLLENPSKCEEIGKYNHEYAKENFMASKVALKIEKHLSELI